MRKVVVQHGGVLSNEDHASIGIGSLIIFIAMIVSAGVAASVVFQTMDSMQQQALQTGQETIKDISTGISVSYVSGYVSNNTITQLCFFVKTTAGSDAVDLGETRLQISNAETMPILSYDNTSFSSSVSTGLFQTLNMTNLTNADFGIVVIRDLDSSCSSSHPVINDNDMVGLLVNATSCLNGISSRTSVSGKIVPEQGMSAVFGFTTPSVFTDTIIDLT